MGILVDSTSSLIQLVTAGTQIVHVQASWVDLLNGSTTVTPAAPPTNLIINSAATTTIVPGPAASTSRMVKNISIQNTDASNANTITVQHNDGTNVVTIKKLTLAAGYSFNYESGRGWYLLDSSGTEVVDNTQMRGLFIKSTVVLNGTTSFVLNNLTNTIRARLRGGGGAGGGCPATTAENGSGGSSGGLALWTVGVTPGATLTCAVGAGGTGVSAAAGNPGGITTLTVGGTTCTANGGLGGNVGIATNSVAGAASPAVSTNGTFNGGGTCGGTSVFGATGAGQGGNGGSCEDGGGGLGKVPAQGTGGAATVGFGGGGGGGLTSGTAQLGGAGANGVLIIDEYT